MTTNRIDIQEVEKNGTEMPTLEACSYNLEYLDWKRQQDKCMGEEPEDDGIVYNAEWLLKNATKMLKRLYECGCTKYEIIREIGEIICYLATASANLAGDMDPFAAGMIVREVYIERLIALPDLWEEVIIDEGFDIPFFEGEMDYGYSFQDVILADDEEPEIELQGNEYDLLEESCYVTRGEYCPFK